MWFLSPRMVVSGFQNVQKTEETRLRQELSLCPEGFVRGPFVNSESCVSWPISKSLFEEKRIWLRWKQTGKKTKGESPLWYFHQHLRSLWNIARSSPIRVLLHPNVPGRQVMCCYCRVFAACPCPAVHQCNEVATVSSKHVWSPSVPRLLFDS